MLTHLHFIQVKERNKYYKQTSAQYIKSLQLSANRDPFKARSLCFLNSWWGRNRKDKKCTNVLRQSIKKSVWQKKEKCLISQNVRSHRPRLKEETGWSWFSRWYRNDATHWADSLHNATPASPWQDGNPPSLLWWFPESLCGACKSNRINKTIHTDRKTVKCIVIGICYKQ